MWRSAEWMSSCVHTNDKQYTASRVLSDQKRVRGSLTRTEPQQLDPNSVLVLEFAEDGSVREVQRLSVYEFDTRQFKDDVVDYLSALAQAVAKRARISQGTRQQPFIGLSPGYDSGALQALLTLSKTPHVAYHIVCTEDVTEIEDRFAWSGDMVEGSIILLSQEDLLQQMRFLRDGSESREADDAASTG
ncbi:Hypothetical protein (Fragment), partial [Durusdinium trenchii]